MLKNVLILSTSLRKNSNSEAVASAFAKGARDAGHRVQEISLRGKNIGFCKGCLACQKTESCVIQDDAVEIAQQMQDADVLVFATPIYYYEMSGQMKTLLDRVNSLYGSDYRFKEIYFLSTAAEDEKGVDSWAIGGLEGWIACFERARLAGSVFAGGVNEAGEIEGHQALRDAYRMGSKV